MDKIAVLHTTPVTIPTLNSLIKEKLPQVMINNFLDDSILPMLNDDISTLEYAFEKMLCFSQFAQKQGAKIILNACSSVGDFVDYAKGMLNVPLLRIDDAVSDIAVASGKRIAVLATLRTTLEPSCRLLRKKGDEFHVILPVLVEGASAAGKAGNKAEHDRLIACKIREYAQDYDVIYLAQASMAGSAATVPEFDDKVLFSTIHAVNRLANMYKAIFPEGSLS